MNVNCMGSLFSLGASLFEDPRFPSCPGASAAACPGAEGFYFFVYLGHP